jgi:hypothetical protein
MQHHHEGHVEMKPKMDMSMRWATSDSFAPILSFFVVLGHKASLVSSFLINRTPRVGGED